MPNVVTIDELVEELADEFGIYPTEANPDKRVEFVAELTERIRQASRNERLLQAHRFSSVQDFTGVDPADKPDKSIEPPELTYVNENWVPSPWLTHVKQWIKSWLIPVRRPANK